MYESIISISENFNMFMENLNKINPFFLWWSWEYEFTMKIHDLEKLLSINHVLILINKDAFKNFLYLKL